MLSDQSPGIKNGKGPMTALVVWNDFTCNYDLFGIIIVFFIISEITVFARVICVPAYFTHPNF
jgi:hypothetical protein